MAVAHPFVHIRTRVIARFGPFNAACSAGHLAQKATRSWAAAVYVTPTAQSFAVSEIMPQQSLRPVTMGHHRQSQRRPAVRASTISLGHTDSTDTDPVSLTPFALYIRMTSRLMNHRSASSATFYAIAIEGFRCLADLKSRIFTISRASMSTSRLSSPLVSVAVISCLFLSNARITRSRVSTDCPR